MTTPQRIQLRRTKGWRKPPGAVVVSRPTMWGNPFRAGESPGVTTPADAVAEYRRWMERRLELDPGALADELQHLAGADLACWCPLDQPCHADVLLDLANGGGA